MVRKKKHYVYRGAKEKGRVKRSHAVLKIDQVFLMSNCTRNFWGFLQGLISWPHFKLFKDNKDFLFATQWPHNHKRVLCQWEAWYDISGGSIDMSEISKPLLNNGAVEMEAYHAINLANSWLGTDHNHQTSIKSLEKQANLITLVPLFSHISGVTQSSTLAQNEISWLTVEACKHSWPPEDKFWRLWWSLDAYHHQQEFSPAVKCLNIY